MDYPQLKITRRHYMKSMLLVSPKLAISRLTEPSTFHQNYFMNMSSRRMVILMWSIYNQVMIWLINLFTKSLLTTTFMKTLYNIVMRRLKDFFFIYNWIVLMRGTKFFRGYMFWLYIFPMPRFYFDKVFLCKILMRKS